MKKFIAFLLSLVFIFSFAGCGNTDKPSNENQSEQNGTTGTSTPAQTVFSDFKDIIKDKNMSASEIAEAIVGGDVLPFSGASMAVEPGLLNGFKGEITGFSEGASFGPLIGSIPFIGYVFKLDPGADTEDFIKTLKDNADLRWNVCTEADEMLCEAVDNTVFFVMSPASFED